MSNLSGTQTFLDAVADAIEAASAYNKHDQVPPAAVLWPDRDRQWEAVLPLLRERAPVFVLGEYSPGERTGPAYWLRCVIARTLPQLNLPSEQVPVLYLPGYGRQDIRALEDCPADLRPLAELQYRGILWTQKSGRDWTIRAFLQNQDGGLGIEVGGDPRTREALQRSLLRLTEEPLDALRRRAPLRAPYLDGLLHPDDVKNVLRWLDDPKGFREESTDQEWAAFVALCEDRYDFHPERDAPITAAEKLGQQDGNWGTVWHRFAEAPTAYGAIPGRLREAKPEKTLPLLHHAESWPQDNEEAERALREALLHSANLDPDAARQAILDLERDHGHRGGWVWASLGFAPMAKAIKHLATMAKASEAVRRANSLTEAVVGYARDGWVADLAVLDALASVERQDDVAAIRSAIRTVYRPWLEGTVTAFQEAVAVSTLGSYAAEPPPGVSEGTCLLFADGLRFDIAQRLSSMLIQLGIESEVKAGLAALPTVTGTAKPAISPAASTLEGGTGFDTSVKATGSRVNAQVLRKAIGDEGFQVLGAEDLGEPSGRAWSELGDIDAYGHEHGWKVAHHAPGELRSLAERIAGLLDHGWEKVIVVTDHGWILMPGGLPKADLPEHLTELRKGRCARLKEGSQTNQQVVPWHWDHSIQVAVAPGIHCYEAGKEYEHGGLSPQECVVPTLIATKATLHAAVAIAAVKWRGLRCNIAVQGPRAGAWVDIRTKGGDPSTTLAMGGKELSADGEAALLVEDEDREYETALIVVVGSDGVVLTQRSTIIGG